MWRTRAVIPVVQELVVSDVKDEGKVLKVGTSDEVKLLDCCWGLLWSLLGV